MADSTFLRGKNNSVVSGSAQKCPLVFFIFSLLIKKGTIGGIRMLLISHAQIESVDREK